MAKFSDLEQEAPELAQALRERLDAHVHKTLATLRKDGSPRICGTETIFFDGDVWIGSMPRAMKARDLRRDPRYALHSGSDDPPGWKGDGKISGRAEEITDPARHAEVLGSRTPGEADPEDYDYSDSHVFRLDIDEASVVRVDESGAKLLIDVWKPGEGVRRIERT